MKFKTTLKAMRENNHVVKFGYCEIPYILRMREPIAFNSGVYGWNCDFYDIGDNVVICTGYRPTGTRYNVHADIYEDKARRIWSDYKKPYEEQKKDADILFDAFCKRIKKEVFGR